MKMILKMIKRNVKLFFKDKGMLFTSLITPAILLVLYVTFLGNVFRDTFLMALPSDLDIPDRLIEGLVGGQLVSSLLAVSCITVAFCSNALMVQDKASGAIKDLRISPAKPTVFSISYYVSTLLCTLMVCFSATALCFGYMAYSGWYLSALDTVLIILDVILLSLFGTALSSIINYFLSTQGQMSAVGSIVSSGYGFICGAYMPISSFGIGLQRVISFLPGTYGTALLRKHALRGAMSELGRIGVSDESIKGLADSIDCNLYFFDNPVSEGVMYVILCSSVALLVGIYILMNLPRRKNK